MASKVIVTRMAFKYIFKQNIPIWSSRIELNYIIKLYFFSFCEAEPLFVLKC